MVIQKILKQLTQEKALT